MIYINISFNFSVEKESSKTSMIKKNMIKTHNILNMNKMQALIILYAAQQRFFSLVGNEIENCHL